jgi:hypothetical protein
MAEMKTYDLMKDAPGCTGMFWRADPRSGKKGSMDNWPRDGAQLQGIVHEALLFLQVFVSPPWNFQELKR